jgi:hypothetical protein
MISLIVEGSPFIEEISKIEPDVVELTEFQIHQVHIVAFINEKIIWIEAIVAENPLRLSQNLFESSHQVAIAKDGTEAVLTLLQ